MRILQICKKMPYPAKDGESIAIHSVSRAFAEKGIKVTILAMNTPKHYVEVEDIPDTLRRSIRYLAIDVNTNPRPIYLLRNLISGEAMHLDRFDNKRFRKVLSELLQEEDYDLIQLEGLFGLQYVDQLRALCKSPIIYRAHNVEFRIWERMARDLPNGIKKWYVGLQAARLKEAELSLLHKPDAIVAITGQDQAFFEKQGLNIPVMWCPAAIDFKEWDACMQKPLTKDIFYIGGLDWPPNQEGLKWFYESVWPRIQSADPEIQWHVAGRNTPDFMRLWHSPVIHLYGEVEDAREFITDHGIMVVPLQSGSGMRIKIIEAMAGGRPVVATSVAAEGLEAEHHKHLLIADDAESFSEAVMELSLNAELKSQIAKNGNDFVRSHFNMASVSEKLLEFYSRFSRTE